MGSINLIPQAERKATPMPDFLIRDLEPWVLERLRERAERNHRSLQAEIHRALRESVKLSKEESLRLMDEIAERLGPSPSDSTEIIREFRDSL